MRPTPSTRARLYIHGRRYAPDLVFWHSADLEDAVEDLAVVRLDRIPAVPPQRLEDLHDDFDDLGIGRHGIVSAGNVEIALVELPHAALGHSRLAAEHHKLAAVRNLPMRGLYPHPLLFHPATEPPPLSLHMRTHLFVYTYSLR